MKYRGIILTGTSGSGKSTLGRLLNRQRPFRLVRAITTRDPRQDDIQSEYEYIKQEDFISLRDNDELFVHDEYRGHYYGIRKSEIETIEGSNEIPVLVLTPKSAYGVAGFNDDRYKSMLFKSAEFLSIFIDASDSDLDSRLRGRNNNFDLQSTMQQRANDRAYKYKFYYYLLNTAPDMSYEAIIAFWDYLYRGGVLSWRLMQLMMNCGMLLENSDPNNLSGASYDLSLGDEYFYGGQILHLTGNSPFLLIEPYDYAIVTSHERADLPRDICARFDLSVSLFSQGVILSNGPQIDPGFRGPLFCLLFNTSSSPVLLKRRQHYATLEFSKLLEPTVIYQGRYQDKDLIHYLPGNATRGAINELKKDLERVEKQTQNVQSIAFAIFSLILALIAVLVIFR